MIKFLRKCFGQNTISSKLSIVTGVVGITGASVMRRRAFVLSVLIKKKQDEIMNGQSLTGSFRRARACTPLINNTS